MLGVERERRRARGHGVPPAGIRTFALVSLIGGLADAVGGVAVLVMAGGVVGLASVAAYFGQRGAAGLTTEMALMVAFLLGALAQQDVELAAGLAVAVAVLLAYRESIHRLVRQTLTEQELHDGLLFAASALIVLPLIPDKSYGPGGALNPFTVWRLVVVVMALQSMGYVALRMLGPRLGLLVSGLAGGFVSSTATIATMGARANKQPQLRRPAVGAAITSTIATVILLAAVLAATSVDVLRQVLLPLVFAGIAAAAYGAFAAWRVVHSEPPSSFDRGRAFDLKTPVVLALTVSLVLVVAGLLEQQLGRAGVLVSAGVAGFADAQAAAAAVGSLSEAGRIEPSQAAIPVLAAFTTNTCSKAFMAWFFGKRRFAVPVWIGLVCVLGAGWLGWLLVQAAS